MEEMMKQSQVDYLESKVDESINVLKTKVSVNKKKTGRINALSISLGALVTLSLGVDVAPESAMFQKNVALALAALLTIINGWNALFDYKKLWIRQKSTLLDLYQLKNQLGYRKAIDSNCNVDDLFEMYVDIWEKDGDEWRKILKTPQPFSGERKDNNNREIGK